MLLNLDAGEHAEEPETLWALADLLCVACGGHAGDLASMTRLVTFCARTGTQLGAHPSYPDRAGFGRTTPVSLSASALAASLVEQCTALATIAAAHGIRVAYVKPHGALYHDVARDPTLARLVIDATRSALGESITFIGQPFGSFAAAAGTRYLREGFADRRARPDGSLVPRSEPDALITEPGAAAARAHDLMSAREVDTICCHADTPGALEIVSAVRASLNGNS